jgi:hypothetical protein
VTDSGLAKVRRAVLRFTANAAERLAQNLEYRQAAIRNAVPTKIALRPPTTATKLLPAKSVRSAWCRFAMTRVPKIEKPKAWLIRLSPVAVLSRVCRVSNRSAIRTFDSDA